MNSKGILLTLLVSMGFGGANLLLRSGLSYVDSGPISEWPSLVRSVVLNAKVVGGVAIAVMALVAWMRVLATETLGASYPTLVCFSLLIVTVGAVVFLGEAFTLRRCVGVSLILVSVYLLNG